MTTTGHNTVADELAVRNLIARIAQFADGGDDLDEYVTLFTPDAVQAFPGAPRTGRADIRAGAEERRATGTAGPGSNSRHHITTQHVVIDGDTATSSAYWLFLVDTTTNPTVRLTGHYLDTCVRTAEGWQLAHRAITFG